MSEVVLENLRQMLVSLTDRLNLIPDPNSALTVLFDIIIVEIKIEKKTLDLGPSDYLNALSKLEKWYLDRNYDYPYPDRLKEQREYWQRKQTTS